MNARHRADPAIASDQRDTAAAERDDLDPDAFLSAARAAEERDSAMLYPPRSASDHAAA